MAGLQGGGYGDHVLGIETVRAAVVISAFGLRSRPDTEAPFLERDLRDGLVAALGGTQEKKILIQGWSPTLGGVDVFVPGAVIPELEPERSTGIETKVWATDEVLYDLLKLAAMCQQADLGVGYAVVAARHRDWAADATRDGVISQMSTRTLDTTTWPTVEAIGYEGPHWRKMIEKTSVKPAWVPARIATFTTDSVPVPAVQDHEIRIVGVRPISDDRLRLDEHGSVVDS